MSCLQYSGIILHHSACTSINGKGFDYYIDKRAAVTPAFEPVGSPYIHICVEGDFATSELTEEPVVTMQLFALQRSILRLYERYPTMGREILPHGLGCPGPYFPWSKLVISPEERYH